MSQKIACLTIDVEPDIGSSAPEIELFQDRQRLDELAGILERHQAVLTGFLVTRLLLEAPELIRQADASLPIRWELHSHSHRQEEPDSERELNLAIEAYQDFFRPSQYSIRASKAR